MVKKKGLTIKLALRVDIFELPHLNNQHEQKYVFYRTAGVKSTPKFD
jgi:hypothetical protein